MNKYFLYVVIIFLSKNSFSQETDLKTCQKFINKSADVKPLLREQFYFDVDKDGELDNFEYRESGGSCHTTSIDLIVNEKESFLNVINSKRDGYAFGLDAHAVTIDKSLYAIFTRNNKERFQSMAKVSKKGFSLICEFKSKIIKKIENYTNPELCKKIIDGGEISSKSFKYGVRMFEINETLFESSAGCGCRYIKRTLLPDNYYKDMLNLPPLPEFSKKFSQLAGKEENCYDIRAERKWRFFKYNKKDYLGIINENANINKLSDPLRHYLPTEIYFWNGHQFELICSQKIITELIATVINNNN
jgi:plasmid maintenance system killer protein